MKMYMKLISFQNVVIENKPNFGDRKNSISTSLSIKQIERLVWALIGLVNVSEIKTIIFLNHIKSNRNVESVS